MSSDRRAPASLEGGTTRAIHNPPTGDDAPPPQQLPATPAPRDEPLQSVAHQIGDGRNAVDNPTFEAREGEDEEGSEAPAADAGARSGADAEAKAEAEEAPRVSSTLTPYSPMSMSRSRSLGKTTEPSTSDYIAALRSTPVAPAKTAGVFASVAPGSEAPAAAGATKRSNIGAPHDGHER